MKNFHKLSILLSVAILVCIVTFSACKKRVEPDPVPPPEIEKPGENEFCDCLSKASENEIAICLLAWREKYLGKKID